MALSDSIKVSELPLYETKLILSEWYNFLTLKLNETLKTGKKTKELSFSLFNKIFT